MKVERARPSLQNTRLFVALRTAPTSATNSQAWTSVGVAAQWSIGIMYSIQPLWVADLASYLGRWFASSNDTATPNPSARSAERSSSPGLLPASMVDSSIHHLRMEEWLSAGIAALKRRGPRAWRR